ncbi:MULTISPECIES: hypothetical protein [Cupriavidus]|uniref:hypothetical protein n=1 Tax=Cupriavidus sp. DF5525 TaxID=3160989 RepID=UPI0003B0B466|nr:signal peptide protein [Ralstonia pickettii DTP0602]
MPAHRLPPLAPLVAGALALAAMPAPAADAGAGALLNRGNDPFLQVSARIPACPEPAGPRITEAQWRHDAHHRIEQGNHCWTEGRCRLSNAFQYDREIADSLRRRLETLSATLPGWRDSSLWITVSGRWLVVQGCVRPGFAVAPFLAALGEVADVERVIDQTTATPARGVPYARYVALPAGTPDAPRPAPQKSPGNTPQKEP